MVLLTARLSRRCSRGAKARNGSKQGHNFAGRRRVQRPSTRSSRAARDVRRSAASVGASSWPRMSSIAVSGVFLESVVARGGFAERSRAGRWGG